MRSFCTKNCFARCAAQQVILAALLLTLASPAHSEISRKTKRVQHRRIPAEIRLTAEDVARLYRPAVVLIICEDTNGESVQGSGFFVSPNVIVTNYHVIEDMVRGQVTLAPVRDRRVTTLPINSVLAFDAKVDLALLSVNRRSRPGAQPVTSGVSPEVAELLAVSKQAKGETKTTRPQTSSPDDPLGIREFLTNEYAPSLAIVDEPVNIGETIYVLGNPDGLFGSISQGIVSGIRRTNASRLIQITAPISPGSSGGPVINTKGQVVGVVVASLSEGQNLNFAIDSESVLKFVTRYHP
jgi:S1-C subfamily serine protease